MLAIAVTVGDDDAGGFDGISEGIDDPFGVNEGEEDGREVTVGVDVGKPVGSVDKVVA